MSTTEFIAKLEEKLNGLVGRTSSLGEVNIFLLVTVVFQVLKRLKILLGPSPSQHIVL